MKKLNKGDVKAWFKNHKNQFVKAGATAGVAVITVGSLVGIYLCLKKAIQEGSYYEMKIDLFNLKTGDRLSTKVCAELAKDVWELAKYVSEHGSYPAEDPLGILGKVYETLNK